VREGRARDASREEVEVATPEMSPEEFNRLSQARFRVLFRRNGSEIIDVTRNDVTIFPLPVPVLPVLDIPFQRLHGMLVDLYEREMLEACLMEADGLSAGPCADLDGGQRTIIRGHRLLLV
jgi:hypothetical protein